MTSLILLRRYSANEYSQNATPRYGLSVPWGTSYGNAPTTCCYWLGLTCNIYWLPAVYGIK